MSGLAARREAHIPTLDGVRGVAILLVLAAHITWLLPQETSRFARLAGGWLSLGWCGVQLFFVLSGFLITRILLARKSQPSGYYRDFYTRRALRIFPLYYAALGVIALLRYGAGIQIGPEGSGWWWYLLYTQNWTNAAGHIPPGVGHFWSLAIEEQFYLLWPFLVLHCSRRTLGRLYIAVVAGVILVRLVGAYALGTPAVWLYQATPAQLDGLAMGALFAVAEADGTLEQAASKAVPAILLGLGSIALLAKISHSTAITELTTPTPFSVAVPQAFALTFFGGILLVLTRPAAHLSRAMRWPWLRGTGRIAYGLYVIHYPVSWALARPSIAHRVGLAAPVLYLLLTVGIAQLSWRYLESPFLALKDRFSGRAERPQEAAPQPSTS
jgi:peptidoglycan/LPS O-acetylase OafA/YrhL